MNVAILHCHYRRGGVTQVVENHVAGLADRFGGEIVLVSGGRNDGLSSATLGRTKQLVIEQLDYDVVRKESPTDGGSNSNGEALRASAGSIAEQIDSGLRSLGLSPETTLLHWHNHSLGKNVATPIAIKQLSVDRGYRQLLQIHDFAEDFRPENYLRVVAAAESVSSEQAFSSDAVNAYSFPNSPLIRYATLTSGDADVLRELGIADERIHVLPNSVTLGANGLPDAEESLTKIQRAAGLPPDARWCVYPVRGIRRKNLGEFLLLSRLTPANTYAGITLAPATDIESWSYERWRRVAREVAPMAVFDAGTYEGVSFQDNLAAADFIVSTSVAEGFGMAFLEPWLAHRGVIARRLPGVVRDFTQSGVKLDRFYRAIEIPGDKGWIAACRRESSQAFCEAWSELPQRFGESFRVEAMDVEVDGATIDFATLTTKRQIEVLNRMASDEGFQVSVAEHNIDLVRWLAEPFERSVLDDNADLIMQKYSTVESARKLGAIYQSLLQTSAATNGETIALNLNASVVEMICGKRTYFPCRTEWEIAE